MTYETVRYEVADAASRRSPSTSPTRATRCRTRCSTTCSPPSTAARDDDAVRCVVLTSTHEKVFSAGGNLAGFAAEVPLVHKHFGTRALPARCSALIGELGKPSICAANGHVLAGALGLALACDLIVAKEGARSGRPRSTSGVFPFMIMALIYRNVGRKKTNELLLLGERIDAEEAERIGIVNRVVAAGRVRRGGRRVGRQARRASRRC